MTTEIKIVIADDHPIVRQGLRQAIESAPELKVLSEAGDGQQALDQICSLQPHVAILDIDMPLMDGFMVAREILKQKLPVEIIFLTIHRSEDIFDEALEVGAKGYVLKDSALTDIVSGIKAVSSGQHYMSPALTSYLVRHKDRPAAAAKQKNSFNQLTATERRILKLIAEYKTSKEVAEELFISHRTVETHRANICAKLDIHGSHALMKFALTHKAEL